MGTMNYYLGTQTISGSGNANFELYPSTTAPTSYIVGIAGCNWMGASGNGIGISFATQVVASEANPGYECIQVTQTVTNVNDPSTTDVVVLGTWLEEIVFGQQAAQYLRTIVPSQTPVSGSPVVSTAIVSGFDIQNASSGDSISTFGFGVGTGYAVQDGGVVPAAIGWGIYEGKDDFTNLTTSRITPGLILATQPVDSGGIILSPISAPIGTANFNVVVEAGFPTAGQGPVIVALIQGFAVEQSEMLTGSMPGVNLSVSASASTTGDSTTLTGTATSTVYLGSLLNPTTQGAFTLLLICLDANQTIVFPAS